MKILTAELIDTALDWAVEEALGGDHTHRPRGYSTDPELGQPIVDRENIELNYGGNSGSGEGWGAEYVDFNAEGYGATRLIAGMRCFVASKLGSEVAVPDELVPPELMAQVQARLAKQQRPQERSV
jgi:hypothetical protein